MQNLPPQTGIFLKSFHNESSMLLSSPFILHWPQIPSTQRRYTQVITFRDILLSLLWDFVLSLLKHVSDSVPGTRCKWRAWHSSRNTGANYVDTSCAESHEISCRWLYIWKLSAQNTAQHHSWAQNEVAATFIKSCSVAILWWRWRCVWRLWW